MPRLFTALELPERIVSQLAVARGGLVGARWLEAGDYHITLRFIGDVDGRVARDIAETLGDIRRPKAPVRFEGLSWFGGDKPRAIIARVKSDPALIDLQAEQERRLRRIGVEPETRKYTPHVTLARLRAVARRPLSPTIPPPAARFRRRRSPLSALRSFRPATGRGGAPCRRGRLSAGLGFAQQNQSRAQQNPNPPQQNPNPAQQNQRPPQQNPNAFSWPASEPFQ